MKGKLTDAQTKGLAYFSYLALSSEERKALRAAHNSPKYPDPRVIKALCDKGLIRLTHHEHGPHYAIAETVAS